MQNIAATTVQMRIKRGMSPKLAKSTPLMVERKLTVAKVLEVEAHGLSQSKSAYLLRVSAQTLGKFIKRHGIEWRGRGRCFYTEGCDPNSAHQKIIKSGIPQSTIYMRMSRKGMTVDEAINHKKGAKL